VPKVMINASERWWNNWQAVMNQTIDGLVGLTAQINNHQINGEYDAEDLLNRIEGQIRDLRRNLEAIRLPF